MVLDFEDEGGWYVPDIDGGSIVADRNTSCPGDDATLERCVDDGPGAAVAVFFLIFSGAGTALGSVNTDEVSYDMCGGGGGRR